MSRLKICVYAICKNEEQFVDRWVDSMSEADMITVTDTGSTDNTVKKLKQRGVKVFREDVKPWRFDKARNIALSHIPEDVDICVSTDLDEVFKKGWRKSLDKVCNKDTTRCKYHYTWSFLADGAEGVTFFYDRIHARKGHKWVGAAHESLKYVVEGKEKIVWSADIRLMHYPDKSKDRSYYLDLLKLSVDESPNEPRGYHYLGREYMFACKWDDSIDMLKKHLALPKARWKAQRSASMRFIARCYRAKHEASKAKEWLYRAIAEAPASRDPYVDMAKLMYDNKEWAGIYHMVTEALKIKDRSTYINDACCWDFTIYDLGALACYYLGLMDKAKEFAKIAMDMEPKNERLKENYDIILG